MFWENIQNCLTGYLALLPTYFKWSTVWILLYLCFNTTLSYSRLYKSRFHVLVNIDWQSIHVINTYTLEKTSVTGFTHFENWMSRHNNTNINVWLYFIINTILNLFGFHIFCVSRFQFFCLLNKSVRLFGTILPY